MLSSAAEIIVSSEDKTWVGESQAGLFLRLSFRHVDRLGLRVQAAADLNPLTGKLLRFCLIVQAVDFLPSSQHKFSAHLLRALHSTLRRGTPHQALGFQHLLVRMRKRMDIHRALAVGNFPTKSSHDLAGVGQGCKAEHRTHEIDRSSFHRSTLLAVSLRISYGSTTNFMCMPSWSSLQMTVQTTS